MLFTAARSSGLTKPDEHSFCVREDFSHYRNLMTALHNFCLIDADGMQPNSATSLIKAKAPNDLFGVRRDLDKLFSKMMDFFSVVSPQHQEIASYLSFRDRRRETYSRRH